MSSSQAPQPFIPPNQGLSAEQSQQAAGALGSLGGTTTGTAVPGYQALYSAAQNNPYYAPAQAGASALGQSGVNFGQGLVTQAQGMEASANNLQSYAPGIAQAAFDPQNAYYNQAFNQQQQQSGAQMAQSGVLGSPYGAAAMNQGNSDFNLAWGNNKFNRELQGVGALGTLGTQAANINTAAGNLGAAGLNMQETGNQYGYDFYNQNQQNIGQSLNNLVQGDVSSGTPYTQSGQLADAYLGIGQEAYKNQLSGWQAQQQADNSFWSGLSSLGGLAMDFIPF